ncbi:hypothetical protein [Aequorivita echinoideorum]|uniref:Anti-sigma factor n=1 Tax=Aequorivita echinoideorum TaxID=1549647 RepID=A0ABS5S0A6_9FLAO|nr:hypothetical protein [Aequorivita echinoideorum]MBT0606643.1 hypothetical protein [Aequorivita echinoideorum]
MAPIKLEENIREKLEGRELKPSAEAWKKLEAKLEKEQPRKHTTIWYYAAASFVGILILASVFFSRNASEIETRVVEENLPKETIENQNEMIPNVYDSEKIASEENGSDKENATEKMNSEKEKSQKTEKNQFEKYSNKNESAIDKKLKQNEAIATTSEEKSEMEEIENPISEAQKRINEKVNEVVAEVQKRNNDNDAITADEVEMLLKKARREIQTERILKTKKVDATALLEDVELELEKSFRDKVFDALGEGFQKIRTAVSERNQ